MLTFQCGTRATMTSMRFLVAAALLCGLAPLGPALAQTGPRAADLVHVELLAEPAAIRPGEPFTVGVRLTMKAGWHTYWRNPGDSGLATEVKWVLPAGFAAGEIQWPTPQRLPVAHLVNYGFEDETILLTQLVAPAGLAAGRSLELKAEVNYLVCQRECIPGEAAVTATVRAAAAAEAAGPDRAVQHLFEAARRSLPVAATWPSSVEPDGEGLRLRVEASGFEREAIRSAYFFPRDETALEHAAPQALAVEPSGLSLKLTRSALSTGPAPRELAGVLVLEEAKDGGTTRRAFSIGPQETRAGAVTTAPPQADSSVGALLQAALLAFAGGLVLNLMPCVFPVLSIKVLSLVKHSGLGPRAVRLSGLSYTAGVLASFLALAGLLLAVRAGGAEIGWGFQLQSPVFVAALAFLLFALGLSLSGAVAFGTALAGVGSRLADRAGSAGSFGSGVLAAVVATPCTAPFMGAAVGYALAAPAPAALAIFTALGLGLAAPFLLLTAFPGLVTRLPRPGAWMEALKQLLAFPLYLTVAWLVFVLSQQVGPAALFAVLIGLVLVAFGVWSLRLASGREGVGRRIGQGAALASVAALAAIAWSTGQDRPPALAVDGSSREAAANGAQPFTQARLDALAAQGRPVFVNLTAAWCITCLVNERSTLSAQAVKREFEERQVTYLKGDWTNQNPEITRLLERHGRSGVPLYLLYPGRGEPILLPQILTEAVMIENLRRVSAVGDRRAEFGSNPNPR